jgi:hypothetical protein
VELERLRELWVLIGCACQDTDLFDEPGVYFGTELGAVDYDNACDPHALSCDQRDDAVRRRGIPRYSVS